jgi:hypothetical protein
MKKKMKANKNFYAEEKKKKIKGLIARQKELEKAYQSQADIEGFESSFYVQDIARVLNNFLEKYKLESVKEFIFLNQGMVWCGLDLIQHVMSAKKRFNISRNMEGYGLFDRDLLKKNPLDREIFLAGEEEGFSFPHDLFILLKKYEIFDLKMYYFLKEYEEKKIYEENLTFDQWYNLKLTEYWDFFFSVSKDIEKEKELFYKLIQEKEEEDGSLTEREFFPKLVKTIFEKIVSKKPDGFFFDYRATAVKKISMYDLEVFQKSWQYSEELLEMKKAEPYILPTEQYDYRKFMDWIFNYGLLYYVEYNYSDIWDPERRVVRNYFYGSFIPTADRAKRPLYSDPFFDYMNNKYSFNRFMLHLQSRYRAGRKGISESLQLEENVNGLDNKEDMDNKAMVNNMPLEITPEGRLISHHAVYMLNAKLAGYKPEQARGYFIDLARMRALQRLIDSQRERNERLFGERISRFIARYTDKSRSKRKVENKFFFFFIEIIFSLLTLFLIWFFYFYQIFFWFFRQKGIIILKDFILNFILYWSKMFFVKTKIAEIVWFLWKLFYKFLVFFRFTERPTFHLTLLIFFDFWYFYRLPLSYAQYVIKRTELYFKSMFLMTDTFIRQKREFLETNENNKFLFEIDVFINLRRNFFSDSLRYYRLFGLFPNYAQTKGFVDLSGKPYLTKEKELYYTGGQGYLADTPGMLLSSWVRGHHYDVLNSRAQGLMSFLEGYFGSQDFPMTDFEFLRGVSFDEFSHYYGAAVSELFPWKMFKPQITFNDFMLHVIDFIYHGMTKEFFGEFDKTSTSKFSRILDVNRVLKERDEKTAAIIITRASPSDNFSLNVLMRNQKLDKKKVLLNYELYHQVREKQAEKAAEYKKYSYVEGRWTKRLYIGSAEDRRQWPDEKRKENLLKKAEGAYTQQDWEDFFFLERDRNNWTITAWEAYFDLSLPRKLLRKYNEDSDVTEEEFYKQTYSDFDFMKRLREARLSRTIMAEQVNVNDTNREAREKIARQKAIDDEERRLVVNPYVEARDSSLLFYDLAKRITRLTDLRARHLKRLREDSFYREYEEKYNKQNVQRKQTFFARAWHDTSFFFYKFRLKIFKRERDKEKDKKEQPNESSFFSFSKLTIKLKESYYENFIKNFGEKKDQFHNLHGLLLLIGYFFFFFFKFFLFFFLILWYIIHRIFLRKQNFVRLMHWLVFDWIIFFRENVWQFFYEYPYVSKFVLFIDKNIFSQFFRLILDKALRPLLRNYGIEPKERLRFLQIILFFFFILAQGLRIGAHYAKLFLKSVVVIFSQMLVKIKDYLKRERYNKRLKKKNGTSQIVFNINNFLFGKSRETVHERFYEWFFFLQECYYFCRAIVLFILFLPFRLFFSLTFFL